MVDDETDQPQFAYELDQRARLWARKLLSFRWLMRLFRPDEVDDRLVLCSRIGVTARPDKAEYDKLSHQDRQLIQRYVRHVIDSIDWYGDAIARGRFFRYTYIVMSLALLIALPWITYSMGVSDRGSATVDASADDTATAVVSQLGVILAIVLAFQKVVQQLFGETSRFAAFWSARTRVKAILFTLEEQFATPPAPVDGELPHNVEKEEDGVRSIKQELRTALHTGAAEAKTIVDEETADYFANLKLPEIDITGALTGARQGAASLVGAFRSGAAQRGGERRRLEAALTAARTEIQALNELVDKRVKEQKKASTTDERKAQLETELEDLRTRILEKEKAIAADSAALAALA